MPMVVSPGAMNSNETMPTYHLVSPAERGEEEPRKRSAEHGDPEHRAHERHGECRPGELAGHQQE